MARTSDLRRANGRKDGRTDRLIYRTPQSGPKLTFKVLYNQNMSQRAVQYKHNSSSAYVTAYFAVLLLIE